MKKVFSVFLAVVLVLLVSQFAMAKEKKQAQKPGGVIVDAVSITATVESIDQAKRTVTLKGPEGNTRTFTVGKEAKNFDQVKAGDKVTVTYLASIALFVRKSNEKPLAEEVQTIQVAPKGGQPGGVVTDTIEITAKVEAIDYKKRTVTLKGPEGNTRTLPVDKRVKKFKNVKVGDEVVVRATQELAITVDKP